ncbi:hypothetical protein STVA_31500 [Allostella vacuolata]|nr:hypothetical protein STVA_31500 [Stella vacuolata]
MKTFLTGLVLAAAVAWTVPAAAQSGGAIEVAEPWARPSPGGSKMSAAYLTLHNKGAAADQLLSASAPVAESVELHTVVKDGDVMRMRPVAEIEVAPGSTTVLQPGGFHIMLIGLKAPLKQGDRFPLELTFAKAGQRQVEVTVGAPGAAHGTGHRH